MKISFSSFVFGLLSCSALVGAAGNIPKADYDVIIVGGGPAGLSALSGVSRVRRKALLYDSQEYRNGLTRHMHDVIGNDGTVPSVFRAKAREQISRYHTATIKNGTVKSITPDFFGDISFFVVEDDDGNSYSARKIVLGTGVRDILPSTPGLKEAWSRGIFWCPWCDGYEHRDQPFGVLGPLSDVLSSVLKMETLNKDIIAFLNGTYTPEEVNIATNRSSTWKKQLEAYNVKLDNRTIKSIERLQDGSKNFSTNERKEFDLFRVHFYEGPSVDRAAFLTNFKAEQRSRLPYDMGLTMDGYKIKVDKTRTSLKGVFAVGDADNDGSTNVPHAMYTGKKAAVSIHVEIEKENSLDMIDKRDSEFVTREMEKRALRTIGSDFERLWDESRV